MDQLEPLFIGCACESNCVGECDQTDECVCRAQHDMAYNSERRLKDLQCR